MARKQHLDHLSETEAEHSTKSEDEDSGSRARASGLRPMTKADGNGQVTNRKGGASNGNAVSKSGGKSSSKSKGSFLPKAAAAMATFIMSGIFHEHITYFTLGFANGEVSWKSLAASMRCVSYLFTDPSISYLLFFKEHSFLRS